MEVEICLRCPSLAIGGPIWDVTTLGGIGQKVVMPWCPTGELLVGQGWACLVGNDNDNDKDFIETVTKTLFMQQQTKDVMVLRSTF